MVSLRAKRIATAEIWVSIIFRKELYARLLKTSEVNVTRARRPSEFQKNPKGPFFSLQKCFASFLFCFFPVSFRESVSDSESTRQKRKKRPGFGIYRVVSHFSLVFCISYWFFPFPGGTIAFLIGFSHFCT